MAQSMLGLVGPRGVTSAFDALRRIREEALRNKIVADQEAQRAVENQLAERRQVEVERGNRVGEGFEGRRVGQGDVRLGYEGRGVDLAEKRYGLDVNADTRAAAEATRRQSDFDLAEKNRNELTNMIQVMPQGPSRQLMDFRRVGAEAQREDLMSPSDIGREKGEIATGAWQGGGKQIFTDQQRIDAQNRPAPQQTLSANQEFQAQQKLKTTWDKATENYRDLKLQADNMKTGLESARKGDLNAGGQAVLVTFNKILDPTSVVRESEYARSAAGQALLARIQGYAQQLAQGGTGVTLQNLEAYARMADEFVKNAENGLAGRRSRLEREAQHYGLRPELIFDSDVGKAAAPPAGPSSAVEKWELGPDGKPRKVGGG